ncbi:hypothetical protein FRB90_012106 [Tulasnella sp. 427]|nr:hypothetical protein FRB90_012106 [Tulasnella sp. 427]
MDVPLEPDLLYWAWYQAPVGQRELPWNKPGTPMTVIAEPAITRKGKEKESDSSGLPSFHWSLGWEQVQALVSDNRQSLQWLNNGLVLSAHALLARVCARYVHASPSAPSTTFEFPDPQVDLSPYGPPTIISATQSLLKSSWVYAYFPPTTERLHSGDGLACVWDCQSIIGSVTVLSWWLVKKGNGPVAGRWIGQPRDWFIDRDKREPQRERPLGPVLSKGPMLLLVTESTNAEIVYRSDRPPNQFAVLKASLQSASFSSSGDPVSEEPPVGPAGARLCTKAAIGLGSDSESIIVATASRVVPRSDHTSNGLDILDMTADLTLDGPVPGPSSKNVDSYPTLEEWGEKETIDLCEVRISAGNEPLFLETYPLFPINLHWTPEPWSTTNADSANGDHQLVRQLVSLEFTNLVPPAPDKAPESGKSDDIDMADLFEAKPEEEDSVLQLVASFVEFKDFSSHPRSILKQWRLRRSTTEDLEEIGAALNPDGPDWLVKQGPTRVFDSTILPVVQTFPSVDAHRLYVAAVRCNGKIATGRTEAAVGTVKVLDLDLQDDVDFEETPIPAQRSTLGESAPNLLTSSPNRALFALRSSTKVENLTFIRMPQRKQSYSEAHPHLKGITFAENLVLSRLRSSEATDIYLAFWTGGTGDGGDEADAAAQLLQETWSILYPKPAKKFEQERAGATIPSAEIGDNALIDLQLMGLTLGLYRSCPNPKVAERWVAANMVIRLQVLREALMDLTPVVTNQAQPDPIVIKQLVAFTSEAVELTETLLREVVLWEAWRECGSSVKTEGTEAKEEPVPAFVLLILVHRHTARLFDTVLNSIVKLCQRLVTTNHTSRRLFITLLGDSKMDFKSVTETYSALIEKCAAQMQELVPVLNIITEGISQKPGLVHKMSLLVPSLEYPILETEETKAAIQAAKLRHPDRLANSAAPRGRICLRCGIEQNYKVHDLMSLNFFGAFERLSQFQCSCGGRWLSKAAA